MTRPKPYSWTDFDPRDLPRLSDIAPDAVPQQNGAVDLAGIAEALGIDLGHRFRRDPVGCCMVCGLLARDCVGRAGGAR